MPIIIYPTATSILLFMTNNSQTDPPGHKTTKRWSDSNRAAKSSQTIPVSAENIYRNQVYQFIIVDFQFLEKRKPLYYAKHNNN